MTTKTIPARRKRAAAADVTVTIDVSAKPYTFGFSGDEAHVSKVGHIWLGKKRHPAVIEFDIASGDLIFDASGPITISKALKGSSFRSRKGVPKGFVRSLLSDTTLLFTSPNTDGGVYKYTLHFLDPAANSVTADPIIVNKILPM
jgi:hypothetical protein